jgi:hypothetical protein
MARDTRQGVDSSEYGVITITLNKKVLPVFLEQFAPN